MADPTIDELILDLKRLANFVETRAADIVPRMIAISMTAHAATLTRDVHEFVTSVREEIIGAKVE